jgi:hypothetical protein
MRRLLALPALAALALAGCGGSLGELCHADQDCRSGLRCSTSDGTRGVCLYAAAPAVDLGALDRPRPDRPRPDRGVPDRGAPERSQDGNAPGDRGQGALFDRGSPDGAR